MYYVKKKIGIIFIIKNIRKGNRIITYLFFYNKIQIIKITCMFYFGFSLISTHTFSFLCIRVIQWISMHILYYFFALFLPISSPIICLPQNMTDCPKDLEVLQGFIYIYAHALGFFSPAIYDKPNHQHFKYTDDKFKNENLKRMFHRFCNNDKSFSFLHIYSYGVY